MKVLHIIENLNVGAVENWLVRVTQEASRIRPGIKWTFYCTLGIPGKLDADVRQYGCEIIYSPCPLNEKSKFFIHLRRELKRGGYDILHCHHDLLSAFYLAASIGVKIHRRIVHVHNTDEALPTSSRIKYKMLAEPMRQLCLKRSDHIAGISEHVLRKFVRGAGPKPGRDVVVYYGLDVQRFANPKTDPSTLRLSLGLPADSKILLFLGRMNELKNPCFVVEVLKHVTGEMPNTVAVFAGTGPLESEVQRMSLELGLEKRVRVLGWRDDSVSLLHAADVFVFPRLEEPKEGLGLVVVEAQATGLPMITSHGILDDAIVIPDLVQRLPLSLGPQAWAQAVVGILKKASRNREMALQTVALSRFSLQNSARTLLTLYE